MERAAAVLCLSKLSPKKNQTRVQRALRHRARPNPGTHFVEVKTGSVSKKKNPQKLLSFQYLYIIHTIHRVHNFFSVASDFKLTSDGEKN